MLERLQAVRRPPWKRPSGAAEKDAADAVGVDDIRRLSSDLHRVAESGRRRGGQPRVVLMLLLLLVQMLQRRRIEQAADADRISARYQSAMRQWRVNDTCEWHLNDAGRNSRVIQSKRLFRPELANVITCKELVRLSNEKT